MNKLNSFIITILSTSLVLPTAYIAISQPIPNQPNGALANNTLSQTQIRQLAQAVTVKVLSNNKGGSGVLISKQGQTYTILTNAHVISNKGIYGIQTQDGKIYTATVINQGNSLKGNDLAVLQFQSQEKYQIIPLASNSNLAENQEVFAAGFPDDSKEIVISNGKISLLSEQPLIGGYQIGYTNEIRQGMSGGTLLNQSGQLIGINGLLNNAILTETYTYQNGTKPSAEQLQQLRQLSFAVPIQTLAKVAPNLASIPPEWRNQQQAQKLPVGNTFVDKVNNIAEQITVRIDSKNNGNGSGVIIAKQGQTYYVATAAHVVKNPDNYEIIAPDGKRYTVQPENIKSEGADAALIKFTSNQTYSVATIAKYNIYTDFIDTKVLGKKTTWVFVSGFPEVDRGKRKLAPGFLLVAEDLFFRAESNSVSQEFIKGSYKLAYSNLSLPGMSGAPVLNVMGQVIGINAGIENPNISHVEIGFGYGVTSSNILRLATQWGLNKELLKVVKTKLKLRNFNNSDVDLLWKHPLFAIKKPSQNASYYDFLIYANKMWRIQKYSEATDALQELIKLKPDSYQIYYALGLVLGDQEKYEQSFAALDKATTIKPDYYEAWKFKSIVLSELEKYPLALAAIDKAVEYNDNDLSLDTLRASVLLYSQQYPESLAVIDKAIEIQPLLLSFNYIIRSCVRIQLKDYQGALTDLNQIIKSEPDNADAYFMRASVRIYLNDFQGARADYNQAIQLDPDVASRYSTQDKAL